MNLLSENPPFILQWFGEEYEKGFRGNILLCCDTNASDHRTILKGKFPECDFYTTDITEGSDIMADITSSDWLKKIKTFGVKFDFVISIATLEHVVDPIGMMRNIFLLVDKCILHSVTNHPYHKNPIDCYRFMNDWPQTVASYLGLNVKAEKWNETHMYVFFEK